MLLLVSYFTLFWNSLIPLFSVALQNSSVKFHCILAWCLFDPLFQNLLHFDYMLYFVLVYVTFWFNVLHFVSNYNYTFLLGWCMSLCFWISYILVSCYSLFWKLLHFGSMLHFVSNFICIGLITLNLKLVKKSQNSFPFAQWSYIGLLFFTFCGTTGL